jgi:hypothetical protein
MTTSKIWKNITTDLAPIRKAVSRLTPNGKPKRAYYPVRHSTKDGFKVDLSGLPDSEHLRGLNNRLTVLECEDWRDAFAALGLIMWPEWPQARPADFIPHKRLALAHVENYARQTDAPLLIDYTGSLARKYYDGSHPITEAMRNIDLSRRFEILSVIHNDKKLANTITLIRCGHEARSYELTTELNFLKAFPRLLENVSLAIGEKDSEHWPYVSPDHLMHYAAPPKSPQVPAIVSAPDSEPVKAPESAADPFAPLRAMAKGQADSQVLPKQDGEEVKRLTDEQATLRHTVSTQASTIEGMRQTIDELKSVVETGITGAPPVIQYGGGLTALPSPEQVEFLAQDMLQNVLPKITEHVQQQSSQLADQVYAKVSEQNDEALRNLRHLVERMTAMIDAGKADTEPAFRSRAKKAAS